MRFPSTSQKLLFAVASALVLSTVPTARTAGATWSPLATAQIDDITIPPRPPRCKPVTSVDQISISDGDVVTDADFAAFDGKWMTPEVRADELQIAESSHKMRRHFQGTPERMIAMVHLFELTHNVCYLQHLRQFIELALRYRDDHYPGNSDPCRYPSDPDPACLRWEPTPIDDYRGKHVAGWGGVQDHLVTRCWILVAVGIKSCSTHKEPITVTPSGHRCQNDACSGISEEVTGVYAYPIAAFARIVAEDPSLHATYGADAVRYANAALETMWALFPQMHYQPDPTGIFFEGYLEDWTHFPASSAGPWEYNVNAAYMTMLIELWRALDSPFYRNSAPQPLEAEPSRILIPVLVSRFQRYFSDHLETRWDTPFLSPRFRWNYGEGEGIEDSHSTVDMRYIDVLRRNFDRLNARVVPLGEPIAFDPSYLERFAQTFLWKIADLQHWTFGESFLAENVDGGGHRDIGQSPNCKGWVNMAVAHPLVYSICRDVMVRFINAGGAFSIGAHSEVLMNKQYLHRRHPHGAYEK